MSVRFTNRGRDRLPSSYYREQSIRLQSTPPRAASTVAWSGGGRTLRSTLDYRKRKCKDPLLATAGAALPRQEARAGAGLF